MPLTRLTLIASLLSLLVWAPARGDGNHGLGATHDHRRPIGQGRYQLVGYEPGQGVEVLDRATALLFLIDLRAREAAALDAARGTIVTRKLIEETIAPASGDLAWPAASGTQTARPYEHVRGTALLRGGSTALFDSDRGRLILLTSGRRDVIDAPRGVHERQEFQVKDATGTLKRLRAARSQRRAIALLRGIAQAEGLFRRRSKELRFASRAELIEAKILSEAALSVPGYRIEVEPGQGEFAQRRFLARATPTEEGLLHLAVNETGVVHASKSPIPSAPDASLPSHARPLPQPPRQEAPPVGRTPRASPSRPGGGEPFTPR